MRILVLGGDGYLGWPTAMYLSAQGHQVGVLDNAVRRQYDEELGSGSLVPIESLRTRLKAWERVGGKDWCAIAKYLDVKGCTINSGKGELGSLRTIITATGSVVENVVARTAHSYTYAQPFTPIFYHGTMAVEPVTATTSRIVYTLVYDNANIAPAERPAEMDRRRVRFQDAIDKMAAAANAN